MKNDHLNTLSANKINGILTIQLILCLPLPSHNHSLPPSSSYIPEFTINDKHTFLYTFTACIPKHHLVLLV